MATYYFDDFYSLANSMQGDLHKVLNDYVAPRVKELFSKNLQQYVYDAYTPKYYVRRYTNGGLADQSNIVNRFDDPLTLRVTDIAYPNKLIGATGYGITNEYALMYWVETGTQGKNVWPGAFARPAVKITQNAVLTDPGVNSAIARGLSSIFK